MAFVSTPVALATVAATFPTPILLLALRSAAVMAVFPQFRDFRATLGSFLLRLSVLLFSLSSGG